MHILQSHSLSFKPCSSGDACLHPDGPDLPLSEFYTYPDGRPYSRCKTCHRDATRGYRAVPRETPGNGPEALVINKLRSIGIYAAPGKASEWRNLDVVAWGCVRIEVKPALVSHGKYRFVLNHQKRGQEFERSDLVVLLFTDGDAPTFHVLPSTHSIFYGPSGRTRDSLCVSTGISRRGRASGAALTVDLLAYYQDRWDLIEAARLSIAGALTDLPMPHPESLDVIPTRENVRDTGQLPLFGRESES